MIIMMLLNVMVLFQLLSNFSVLLFTTNWKIFHDRDQL